MFFFGEPAAALSPGSLARGAGNFSGWRASDLVGAQGGLCPAFKARRLLSKRVPSLSPLCKLRAALERVEAHVPPHGHGEANTAASGQESSLASRAGWWQRRAPTIAMFGSDQMGLRPARALVARLVWCCSSGTEQASTACAQAVPTAASGPHPAARGGATVAQARQSLRG